MIQLKQHYAVLPSIPGMILFKWLKVAYIWKLFLSSCYSITFKKPNSERICTEVIWGNILFTS